MIALQITVAALSGMIAFVTIEAKGLDAQESVYERISSVGLGLTFGILIVIAMYFSGLLGKIKARRYMRRKARQE